MRKRKYIEEEYMFNYGGNKIVNELLLDIRELLIKSTLSQKRLKTREER